MDKLKEQFKVYGKDSEAWNIIYEFCSLMKYGDVNITQALRRRRMEEVVELRKAKKNEELSRRRKIDDDDSSLDGEIELDPMEQKARIEKINAINGLISGYARMAHEFLKTERPRPIDLFVTHGLIPKLVHFLRSPQNPEVQYIAAWVLTTVAFGDHEQTNAVVNAGAVDPLLELFHSATPRVRDQAVWCIGNISGDGPEMQKYLMDKGLLPKLIEMTDSVTKAQPDQLSNIIWTMSNMCENPGHPNKELHSCLRVFAKRIFHRELKVVREAIRGVSMLSSNEEWLDDIYDTNILSEVAGFLESDDWRIVKSALKIIGHFAAGSDRQAQYIIDCIALPAVLKLMKSPKKQFMKEATRTAGNIACGTYEQILILMNAGIAEFIVHVLDQGDKDSQVEALHLVTNITTLCKIDQLVYLEKNGVILSVCNHLNKRTNSAIYAALKAIHNMLRIADKCDELDEYVGILEEAKGKEYMEELQTHENGAISQRASYVLDKYFNEDETSGTMDSESEMGSGDATDEMLMQVGEEFQCDCH